MGFSSLKAVAFKLDLNTPLPELLSALARREESYRLRRSRITILGAVTRKTPLTSL